MHPCVDGSERAAFLTAIWAAAIHNDRLRASLGRFRRVEMALIEETLAVAFADDADRLLVPVARLAALVHTAIIGLSVQTAISGDREALARGYADLREVILRGALGAEPRKAPSAAKSSTPPRARQSRKPRR